MCTLVLYSSLWASINAKQDIKVSVPMQYIKKITCFHSLKLKKLIFKHSLNSHQIHKFQVVTQLFGVGFFFLNLQTPLYKRKNEHAGFPEENINLVSCENMFFFIIKKIKCLLHGCHF